MPEPFSGRPTTVIVIGEIQLVKRPHDAPPAFIGKAPTVRIAKPGTDNQEVFTGCSLRFAGLHQEVDFPINIEADRAVSKLKTDRHDAAGFHRQAQLGGPFAASGRTGRDFHELAGLGGVGHKRLVPRDW
jgi:hypothetical protein